MYFNLIFFLYHLEIVSHNTTEYWEATKSVSPLETMVFNAAPSIDGIWVEMITTLIQTVMRKTGIMLI